MSQQSKAAEPVARARGRALYCFDLPVIALALRNGHQPAVTIQAGEIFQVVGSAEDDRFVTISVKGEHFLVFECDLKDRGRLMPARKARAAAHAGSG